MRLTIRSDLAMRALMFCAVHQDRTVRTAEVAASCNASENHLGQVINALGHAGFLVTVRGRGGGLRLARAPETIRVGDVMRHLEEGTPFADCFHAEGGTCPIEKCCRLKGVLSGALNAFYEALNDATLADLVADNVQLHGFLTRRDIPA